MPELTTSATDAAPAVAEDQPIRERVKKLTSQVLQQVRCHREVVLSTTGVDMAQIELSVAATAVARPRRNDTKRSPDERPIWRISRMRGCESVTTSTDLSSSRSHTTSRVLGRSQSKRRHLIPCCLRDG